VLIAKRILNGILVSDAQFVLCGGCSREDVALIVIVAHLILSILEGRLCLCHSLKILLDLHDGLGTRLVALDNDGDSDDQKNGCDHNGHDDHHI